LPELYFEGCELTLAPGENRVISVEAGSFDRIGILTSRGNLFPVEADPVDMTTLTVTLVDNETGEPIPGSLGASASLVVHSEEIRIGPKAADEGGRVRFVLPPLKGGARLRRGGQGERVRADRRHGKDQGQGEQEGEREAPVRPLRPIGFRELCNPD